MAEADTTNTGLTEQSNISLLRMLGDWRDSAAKRFWDRFNLFLVVNSGLWAVLYLRETPFLQIKVRGEDYALGQIILSMAGLLISIVWYFLLKAAKYYEQRWYDDMKALIERVPQLEDIVVLYGEKADRAKPPTKYKSSQYAKVVIIIFAIVWFMILLASLGSVFMSEP